ncbi:MAG TPA: hypothetical protein VFB37_04355 [Steroidobacteraceae bacterium]|nr:hypothetical protein [Steroidobacteraceae bacterium]
MSTAQQSAQSSWLQRYILPGLAFKAVVIGGGYATGRELAEFFLPSGPRGGLLAIVVATIVWSVVCALTFSFSYSYRLLDYRAFFGKLLGRGWILFELTYLLLVLLILSVFGATIGAVGHALFGWPSLAGTLLLLVSIAAVVAVGARAVEPVFKYVSVLLYATYAVFLALSLSKFGTRILSNLELSHVGAGWLSGGVTYAGYNSVAAVVILPVLRHLRSHREAVIAGVLAGPLAMLPGLFFFLSMIAWYPEVGGSTLPSDFLLLRIGIPLVRLLFQCMIFFALLESGCGIVHAIMERVRRAMRARTGHDPDLPVRIAVTLAALTVSVFAAQGIGLVELIAKGYRFISWVLIVIFILPIILVSILKPRYLRHSDAAGS